MIDDLVIKQNTSKFNKPTSKASEDFNVSPTPQDHWAKRINLLQNNNRNNYQTNNTRKDFIVASTGMSLILGNFSMGTCDFYLLTYNYDSL